MSLWGHIIEWDVTYTSSLALCTDPSAYFGSLHPIMKFLEYSCHGIPWIFGTVFLILAAHQKDHQQIFVNLLAGKESRSGEVPTWQDPYNRIPLLSEPSRQALLYRRRFRDRSLLIAWGVGKLDATIA